MSLKTDINLNTLPKHVAVIMDGNGRWAKRFGKERIFGHKNGVKAVRACVEASAEIGIKYLTLYAFSTENWKRPKLEVNALMQLLVSALRDEVKTLNKNGIKLNVIGDTEKLPPYCQRQLKESLEKTANNTHMMLTLALNYSGRWELEKAVQDIAKDVQDNKITPQEINIDKIEGYLETSGIPDPELMIRTSGETRISNFLLWQLAYAEFYFTDVFWPDFGKENFFEAILNFQQRERRFGKTSEQVNKYL